MGVYLADSLKKLRLLVSVAAAGKSSGEAILAQTDRILASQYFARSPALSRFLRFVVEQALQDKADELKEYRLGVDVFERGADFDPRIDPIVRMQAAKLRARLAEYYGNEIGRASCRERVEIS